MANDNRGGRSDTVVKALLGIASALALIFSLSDRWAPAKSLDGLEARLQRIEARVDALYNVLIGDGRRGAP